MSNDYFQFKQFKIVQAKCAMKVSTDSCLFGAWVASQIKQEQSLLDIGAGTGLLGLMIAQKSAGNIDAIEIEKKCFEQLKENVENCIWKERFNLYQGDIREFLTEKKYDLIVSNPPFHEKQLESGNEKVNLARHSNQLSLEQLFESTNRMLDLNGTFYLLLPHYRKKECIELASTFELFPQRIMSVMQTQEHSPFRCMISFSRKNSLIKENTIVIRDKSNQYTKDFIELLSDYYLFL
jgi:tRNA1Val (adenine37-N6)-methyltransferase